MQTFDFVRLLPRSKGKWNERLFMETFTAFQTGRTDKDPSAFWYEGELGFFGKFWNGLFACCPRILWREFLIASICVELPLDYYIIPLATKLFKCGVLQVSNDDISSYARQNRDEWEIKGRDIVDEMKQKAQETIGPQEGKITFIDV